MKHSAMLLFVMFVVSFGIIACGPTKTIQELNPGVSFMDKNEVIKYITDVQQIEYKDAIVSYKPNGQASVYVKDIQQDVPATWKVYDDGLVILRTKRYVGKSYFAKDGITTYHPDGTSDKILKR